MRKLIILPGIGNHDGGWSEPFNVAELFDVPKESVIEYTYESYFDGFWVTKILRPLAKAWSAKLVGGLGSIALSMLEEYLGDILLYFLPMGPRKAIKAGLRNLLLQYPDAVVVGFSLGSVVAYEVTMELESAPLQPFLITLGSPLGSKALSPFVKRFLSLAGHYRPMVSGWINVYGTKDPISGYIEDLHCDRNDQFHYPIRHNLKDYLERVAKIPVYKQVKGE